jgi:hypothetical protein
LKPADQRAWETSAFVRHVAESYGASTVLADAPMRGGVGEGRTVHVVLPGEDGPDQPADIVVSLDAPGRTRDWQLYLGERAKLARWVLVVFADNAERLPRRGGPGTTAIAAVLWRLGRVREHAYLGIPRVVAPGPVQAPASALVRWTAPRHVFVVDTAPRTPQARRRLRTVQDDDGGDAKARQRFSTR